MERALTLTRSQIVAIFAKWEAQVRADPTAWADEAQVRTCDLDQHSQSAADVFIEFADGL
ncbi:MAG: hypothetical protein ACK4OJ_12145 [Brevundimonas sp.]